MTTARPRASHVIAIKAIIWGLCLAPALLLVWRFFADRLSANPIEFITHKTGFWALTLLMATLSITPLRRITGWNGITRFRRLIGLFAFFYVTLHFLTYVTLDLFFDFSAIAADIAKRPYITVGFTAFVLLIPLAATSTKGSIRRLGKNWLRLHRLIYVAAVLAVLHFYWKRSAKADVFDPIVFAVIVGALLLARAVGAIRARPIHRPDRRSEGGNANDEIEGIKVGPLGEEGSAETGNADKAGAESQ